MTTILVVLCVLFCALAMFFAYALCKTSGDAARAEEAREREQGDV